MSRVQPAVELTQVTEWTDGTARRIQDQLAAEEPLEIRLNGKPLTVTMRTPGHDEELAAGFLWTEGLIESATQIGEIRRLTPEGAARDNVISVELGDQSFQPEDLQRNFFAASSCGICGKASIEAIRLRGLTPPTRRSGSIRNCYVSSPPVFAISNRSSAEPEDCTPQDSSTMSAN